MILSVFNKNKKMPIYEAEFLGDPVPIKKSKGKKNAKVDEPQEPVEPPKKKRVKKEEAEDIPPKKKKSKKVIEETTPNVVEEPKKKRVKKAVEEEKKKPVKKVKAQEPTPSLTETNSTSGAEPDVVPKKKKTRKTPPVQEAMLPIGASGKTKIAMPHLEGGPDEPPSWFKAYVLDEQKRRNAEKTKKEKQNTKAIKAEAQEIASQKWSDGFTRDKIRNEVDSHMSRLYSMIHGRRF